jgi:hypothetical protein
MSREKFPVIPPGIDPGTFRLVAQCLNHYATPGPWIKYRYSKINIPKQSPVTSVVTEETPVLTRI